MSYNIKTETGRQVVAGNVDNSEYEEIKQNLTAEDSLEFKFATDGEGNYGYLKGDGTFTPFKSGGTEVEIIENHVICAQGAEINNPALLTLYKTEGPTSNFTTLFFANGECYYTHPTINSPLGYNAPSLISDDGDNIKLGCVQNQVRVTYNRTERKLTVDNNATTRKIAGWVYK